MSDRSAGSNEPAGARPAPPSRGAGRRISPVVVFLLVAVIGSVIYMAYAVTVREPSQIPLLASGLVVLAIVFGALAGYCLRETWRAGGEGHGRRALMTSIIGGIAAIVAAGCVAFAIIGFQLASAPA